jgi:hypothetical protein
MIINLTRALHWTPLALTASITASTFFRRLRAFAFRVGDSFHGVFLEVKETPRVINHEHAGKQAQLTTAGRQD